MARKMDVCRIISTTTALLKSARRDSERDAHRVWLFRSDMLIVVFAAEPKLSGCGYEHKR